MLSRYSRYVKFSNFRLINRRHRINTLLNNKIRTMHNAFISSFNKNEDKIKHDLWRYRSYAISDYTNFSSSFTEIVQGDICCENHEKSTLLHRTKQFIKMEYLKGGNL